MTFVDLHSVFEADHPGQAEYERTLEDHRRVVYVRSHGSDDGYVPARLFPCPGALRRLDVGGRIVICDACQFEVSMPVETPAGSSDEEMDW